MAEDSTNTSPCKECGSGSMEAHLQSEIVHLGQHLASVESRATVAEARLRQAEEQRATWRDKYERLYESHKKVQRLNQSLEEKLLGMVDKCKADKSQLTKDIATLSVRLAETKHAFSQLDKENERYKNDMNLAIQLLQCKPDNFVSQKLDTLPVETQARVSQYILSKTKGSSNGSQTKGETELFDGTEFEFNISASLMAKILEDSVQDTVTKHCDTCSCEKHHNKPFSLGQSCYSVGTQVNPPQEDASLCLNCNSDIKSLYSTLTNESHSSPPGEIFNAESYCQRSSPIYLMRHEAKSYIDNNQKLTQNGESIKNNTVVMNEEDKLKITAAKHKEIVNTIGENLKELNLKNDFIEPKAHHRLCDRSKSTTTVEKDSETLTIDDVKDKMHITISSPGTIAATRSGIATNHNYLENNRKNSIESNGTISGTSSIAKSNASTHKSNTHVGPGPRFCSLRVQAGSKNILLDNAQPHVPPVLYTRHNMGQQTHAISEIIVDNDKTNQIANALHERRCINNKDLEDILIDVETLENPGNERNLNPAFTHIPLSPLRPQKAQSPPESTNGYIYKQSDKLTEPQTSPNTSDQVKVFNFDDYESSVSDIKQLNCIDKFDTTQFIRSKKIKSDGFPTTSLPTEYLQKYSIKNVNFELNSPNNTNEVYVDSKENNGKELNRKEGESRVAEKSTSSGSSEDGAARLQQQQLRRVALWLRQHHTVPHPVTKYRHLPPNTTTTLETSFPADIQAPAQTIHKETDNAKAELSSEELARMEYNVKQFLLQQWIPSTPEPTQTIRARTETDL